MQCPNYQAKEDNTCKACGASRMETLCEFRCYRRAQRSVGGLHLTLMLSQILPHQEEVANRLQSKTAGRIILYLPLLTTTFLLC